MKKDNINLMDFDNSIDRWFKFVEDYRKETSVPLSYVLLPNPATTGFRTPGSPFGTTTLSKREWNRILSKTMPPLKPAGGIEAECKKLKKEEE